MRYIEFSKRKKKNCVFSGNCVIEGPSLNGCVFVSLSDFRRFETIKCFQPKESSEPRRTIRGVTLRDLAGVNSLYFCKSFDFKFWAAALSNEVEKPNAKGKGKGLPRTGYEDPEGEYRYSSTFPSTSALDGGGWSKPRPVRFTPGKDPVPIV